MSRISICFLWHMHQPFYKDLVKNEYRLPWTRMHALKDYYGMVKVLEDFPSVHQTFNVVPSMLMQVEEYAEGKAADPWLHLAGKPTEELNEADHAFLSKYFFQANERHLIRRWPRFGELLDLQRGGRAWNTRDWRDLQVWSQLAWLDEEYLEHDAEVLRLLQKGHSFSREDQLSMLAIQQRVLREVLPVYRRFATRGQIEISATPFYHPILPLLCDSDIARVAHPGVPLPTRFRYPEDARLQLERSRRYVKEKLGVEVHGLWPSEGSVSDEALTIAAECGFRWFATDNGVLARTRHEPATPELTYRPWQWSVGDHHMHVLFRDHWLSDQIGFVYSQWNPADAVDHFLRSVRENCAPLQRHGEPVLAPVILDGENAWEYYDKGGREFLRQLYGAIAADPALEAVTVSEAIERVPTRRLGNIFPGSWINANFDIWIGAPEDNTAWEYLLQARRAYDETPETPEQDRELALEELLIAEGSDWCWWYGPEHSSDNREEFDELFRAHLANVWLALRLPVPPELRRPILLGAQTGEQNVPPRRELEISFDGRESSFWEWNDAGRWIADTRAGAMHGGQQPLRELRYGYDAAGDLVLAMQLDAKFQPEFAVDEMKAPPAVLINGRLTELRLAAPSADSPVLQVKVLEAGKPVQQIELRAMRHSACRWPA
jgi:alpha-amylase/alpha-mannosidase (GH57 family)